MTTTVQSASPRRKLALIIVNYKYKRANSPPNDLAGNAKALHDQLQSMKFEVIMIENFQGYFMHEKKLSEFQNKIQSTDLVLVYYTGFSCQEKKKNFLLPIGNDEDEMDINYNDNENDAERILNRLRTEVKPLATIMILDCCRPYVLKSVLEPHETVRGNGLAEMGKHSEALIQFACSANATTDDGLFFDSLLENLDRENVPITKLFNDITEDVYRQRRRRLEPFSVNDLSSENSIYLNPIQTIHRSSGKKKEYAFIIANDNYTRTENRLRKSIRNATALENTLTSINFEVVKHHNITRQKDIMKHVKDFSKTFQNGDTVLFYYSGHGQQVNGNNYLIPTNDDEIVNDEDVEVFGANFQRILDRLTENKPASVFIFILDCCRNSSITAVTQRKGLHAMNIPDKRKIFIQFSCAANRTTDDDYFNTLLLEDIDRENINVTDILEDITENVFNKRHQELRPFSANRLSGVTSILLNRVNTETRPSGNDQKYALIFGNERYFVRENRLVNSIQNAKALDRTLKEINFNVTTHENVAREDDMIQHVKNFTNNFMNGDIVVFYYLGHAQQINNVNYLIPTRDNEIKNAEEIETFGISFERILNRLTENKPASVFIFILNCCTPYLVSDGSVVTSLHNGLHAINVSDRRNIFIQFSCAANRTTRDDLFNKYLLQKIDKKNVPITEIFQDIAEQTYKGRNEKLRPFAADRLPSSEPVYLNLAKSILPDIPLEAKWKSISKTIAGDPEPGSAEDQLHSPQGIAISKNQTILIADSSNHRIMKYSLKTGKIQRIFGKNIRGSTLDMLSHPSNVIFCKQRNTFIICDYYNRRVLEWSGKRSAKPRTLIRNIACFAAALDDKCALYVSDPEQHEVRRYRLGKKRGTVVAGGNGQGPRLKQLNHPTYICVDDNQAVYISDSWNDRVVRWDKGAEEGVLEAGGEGKGKDLTQLDCPAGIVIDQLGTLYVADHWNHRVMRYRKDEKPDIIAGDRFLPGSDNNQLSCPEGLAFDKHNNLYVADSNNHRIQQYRIKKR